jgi:hypothetical protein
MPTKFNHGPGFCLFLGKKYRIHLTEFYCPSEDPRKWPEIERPELKSKDLWQHEGVLSLSLRNEGGAEKLGR